MTSLIFDADDTLWENNVLFERAVEDFIDHLAHPRLSRREVRDHLDAVETRNTRRHGYGVDSFEASLTECLADLRPDVPVSLADTEVLRAACEPIRTREAVELLDGVEETLDELSRRHRLFLLTKGNEAEQTAKVAASGLAAYFADVEVVWEKDASAYERFAEGHGLVPGETWMIGNSPASDVRPALAAGLGAVLVPHPMTWSLEAAARPTGHARFLEVSPFAALSQHF